MTSVVTRAHLQEALFPSWSVCRRRALTRIPPRRNGSRSAARGTRTRGRHRHSGEGQTCVDALGAALASFRCLRAPGWLPSGRQYYGSYEVHGVDRLKGGTIRDAAARLWASPSTDAGATADASRGRDAGPPAPRDRHRGPSFHGFPVRTAVWPTPASRRRGSGAAGRRAVSPRPGIAGAVGVVHLAGFDEWRRLDVDLAAFGCADAAAEPRPEVGGDRLQRVQTDEVALLVGIGFHVVEELLDVTLGIGILPALPVGRMDSVLPARRADGAADLALADLQEGFCGPGTGLAPHQWHEAVALHTGRHGETGGVEQRRRQVNQADQLAELAAAAEAGAGQRHGDARAAVVTSPFVLLFRVLKWLP